MNKPDTIYDLPRGMRIGFSVFAIMVIISAVASIVVRIVRGG